MKFERTESFRADYQRLTEKEREMFRSAVRTFIIACDHFIETRDPSSWPASLRLKAIVYATGIFEIKWSFSGPDGRATWSWSNVTTDLGAQVPAVRWRRLGGHEIFRTP